MLVCAIPGTNLDESGEGAREGICGLGDFSYAHQENLPRTKRALGESALEQPV